MTTSDTTGDRGATWLDDHVELFAVGALTPDETRRVESELAALPPHERAEHDAQIADIQAAMAGFATTYALDAPPELRDRVLQHVFEGAALTPEAYVPSGIEPGPQNPAAAVDPVPPVAPAGTGRSGESDLAPPPPPVELRPRDSRHGQHRSGGTARRPARATAILAAAAVTVAVALGAGVLIGRTTAPESSTSSTALSDSQREVLGVLTAADASVSVEPLADDRGTIAVVTSESADQAVALLRDLRTPIPADSTYQLWLVGGAPQPVSAGLIPGDDTAPVVVDDVRGSSVLAVTIEPAGGSPQPTTPILAQVAL
ncbi:MULTISPECIES: anti-sigma factor [Gordonia]|uniref:Regulator of SigK n=1 Tax=Gordonia hongkongensis TaxID=1701090 RepID=A0ABT6BTB6_9ACTN|nr:MULTISPECIES: anti-sigma factor [Gordonia]MCT1353640.1 anti-sigma factor [Gordonia sp. p3-SID1431]MDF6101183.1 anti-sigma factor [Gordonia hongkongensis]